MLLTRLYTTPELFKPVNFKPGVNFIFGKKAKKTKAGDAKKSINGIGKTTFLDLIDFCLLSSYSKRDSKRLFAAHEAGILGGVSAVLEFTVMGESYSIVRSFDTPSADIILETKEGINKYKIGQLKPILCDLIFRRDDYVGVYQSKWLRKLIPFYHKIQRPKKDGFSDPILYIKESNSTELNQYHLFLMGIDNRLSHRNYEIQTHLKKIEPTLAGIKDFIAETYGQKNIAEASSRVKRLQIEIESLEIAIRAFNLNKQYQTEEEKANELTREIKSLWLENHSDKAQIETFQRSAQEEDRLSSIKIRNLYKDLNILLADNVKKTLDEAIAFRKDLSRSRAEFIVGEIEELNGAIEKRNQLLGVLEAKRAEVFEFLSTKDAIKDLTKAFEAVAEKKNELGNIQSQIKVFQDLSKEKNEIQLAEKKIEGEFLNLKETILRAEIVLSKVFNTIHDAIYPELQGDSTFDITPDTRKESKLVINVLTNTKMLSKGRNSGRTLIYDLTILLHSLTKEFNSPQYLIHDGIFDGMDKAHFIKLYEFLTEQLLNGYQFQYIVTYNEEGTLNDNFGEADLVTTERIEQEAVLVLSPNQKLLGDF